MSLEERKTIAVRYLELLPLGRVSELPLSPNFSGWSTMSGDVPGEEFLSRIAILPKMFTEPLKFTVQAVTGEDNRVAIQCTSQGMLITGTPYDNQYHYLFTFDKEGILKVYEYMNVKKAEIMFPVLQKVRRQ